MLILPVPAWSVALVVLVLAGASVAVGVRWARAVLADADRYVAATSHLPTSKGVRRLSGWVSARAVRRAARRRGLAGLPGRVSVERAVAKAVPALMARRSFRTGWSITHRVVHGRAARARRSGLRSRPLLVALVRLLLAAGGEVVARMPRRVR